MLKERFGDISRPHPSWVPTVLPVYGTISEQTEQEYNLWKWEKDLDRIRRLKETEIFETTDADWVERKMLWTNYVERAEESIYNLRELKKDYKELGKKYDNLEKEHDEAKVKLKKMENVYKDWMNKYEEMIKKYKELGSSYQDLDKMHMDLTDIYKASINERQELSDMNEVLRKKYEDLEGKYRSLFSMHKDKDVFMEESAIDISKEGNKETSVMDRDTGCVIVDNGNVTSGVVNQVNGSMTVENGNVKDVLELHGSGTDRIASLERKMRNLVEVVVLLGQSIGLQGQRFEREMDLLCTFMQT